MNTSIKLTVFFEGIFWVGIFERIYDEKYDVSRIVFGSEPKDCEVYDFILKNFNNLKFTESIILDTIQDKKINPKRLQRKIKKETESTGIGTKAQLTIQLQYETNKTQKKKHSKLKKEEYQKRKFQLKQQKRKEKLKGH